MSTKPDQTRHATIEDRRALLASLQLPTGQATVERRPVENGDQLVVRLSPGAQPASSPATFRGHPVRYEPLRAAAAW